MSEFQHLWSRSCWSWVHQAACSGSVNFWCPATAESRSPTDRIPRPPMIEYSQPPNQPSLIPPAIGVIPCAFSLSQAARSWLHVCGGLTPAFASTSLRKRTGNDGWTYQPAVQTFPFLVFSEVVREWLSA